MLDEKLLQERLKNFQPEPLIKYKSTKTKEEIESKIIEEDKDNIDLAKTNFLDVLNNQEIKKASEDIIRKYGVGTCGPRAFFGTTDIHLELEQKIGKWLGVQRAMVYSYGLVAISSSVAAYCRRSDTVFVDKLTNIGILQGLQSAKSTVVYFDHNDPKSLRTEVEKVVQAEKGKKKSSRKFLIVEGVSWHTGQLLPLPEFVEIAEEFKIRIFLEESYSIGVYGETGKGLTEYFNIEPHRLDMIVATLETAIGSIGGFCAGSQLTIDFQELSGSGYIFSASLPTYLCQACIMSIEMLDDKPKKLQKLTKKFHDFLIDNNYEVLSHFLSAFKVFNGKNSTGEVKNKEIHEFCKKKGVHFLLESDNRMVINLNVALLEDEAKYDKIEKVLSEAIKYVQ